MTSIPQVRDVMRAACICILIRRIIKMRTLEQRARIGKAINKERKRNTHTHIQISILQRDLLSRQSSAERVQKAAGTLHTGETIAYLRARLVSR